MLCFLLACGTCLGQPVPAESPAFSEEKAPAYAYQRVKTKKEREKFLNTYSNVQQNVIYRLNRIDSGSLYRLDTLVIPVPSDSAFQMHSPFPEQLLWARELGKLVIFSYRIQAFGAYNHGRLVRWGPTSIGRRTRLTPLGLYSANWKEAVHVSSIDPDWNMPYTVNLELNSGIAMHQYAMPGKPASHKCMRLQMADAMWLFNWVDLPLSQHKGTRGAFGTPVVVFGKYNFKRKGPWHRLPKNPKATHHTSSALEVELSPYLAIIKERQLQRQQQLLNPLDK